MKKESPELTDAAAKEWLANQSLMRCQACGEFRGHGHDCGWIPWDGHKWSWPDGRSPYDKVIVKTRIGEIWTGFSHEWNWHANNSEDDIIAYKLACYA